MSIYNKLPNNYLYVELFGNRLILAERTALQTYVLSEVTKQIGNDFIDALSVNLAIIKQSLEINFKLLKPYQIIKRWKLKRIINNKRLVRELSYSQIEDLALKVLELEGYKKKQTQKMENVSAEELSSV